MNRLDVKKKKYRKPFLVKWMTVLVCCVMLAGNYKYAAATEAEQDAAETEMAGQEIDKRKGNIGLYYYLNKCMYDSKIRYLEEYAAYLKRQQNVYNEMYELGELTQLDLDESKVQCQLAETEITVACNERDYYALCLSEKNVDVTAYSLKSSYDVHDLEYYRENCKKTDILTIARYVTDYNNALAYKNVKDAEISTLRNKIDAMELLYQEGEISELSLLQEKVALAKAEYERDKYLGDMGIAYCNISQVCK